MPVITVRYIENNRWKRTAKNKNRKETNGQSSYSESVRAKWLGFLQPLGRAFKFLSWNYSQLYQLF